MERASELVGRPILPGDAGTHIGDVTDVLLNVKDVIGLVIRGGMFSSEQVLPYGDVQTIGRDAVIARSLNNVMGPAQWHERHVKAERSSALKNKRVMTVSGRRLGAVKDVRFDEHRTHRSVRSGAPRARRPGRAALGAAAVGRRHHIGPDAVVVSEEAARAVHFTRRHG